MKEIKGCPHRILRGCFASLTAAAVLVLAVSQAAGDETVRKGWQSEDGVDVPSYAVIAPTESNLNVDVLVLSCVDTRTTSVLTLELYLSNEERLIPKGADPDQLRADPRAVILIDGRRYPVTMFFGEDYIVLADSILDHTPFLSRRLIDGMQFGSTMVIRFVLLSGRHSPDAAFDGTASFDLQTGAGGTAIAAVRRCAEPSLGRVSGH